MRFGRAPHIFPSCEQNMEMGHCARSPRKNGDRDPRGDSARRSRRSLPAERKIRCWKVDAIPTEISPTAISDPGSVAFTALRYSNRDLPLRYQILERLQPIHSRWSWS